MGNWLLPKSLVDVLPAEARRIEELHRKLLDLYRTYGFELVTPPLVEYIDSLLSGTGSDLNLRTCKLIDKLSGRTLGVRADMTPQVSRIDAHLLNRAEVTRLCYCGNVFHARPADFLSSRELLQIGAEIYGHNGVEADLEIIQLVLKTVSTAGVRHPCLDLCHPEVVRSILDADPVAASHSEAIISLLPEKDVPGLAELAQKVGTIRADTVKALPVLPGVAAALDALQILASAMPTVELGVDLADVGGYGYHSGVTFALYAEG